jgi:hypothetical protein
MSRRSCSRATSVFFNRHADLAEEAAHHRGVGFDPSLRQKTITQRLKRDVRLPGPRSFQKITVRHELGGPMAAMSDRFSRAVPFYPLKPFDRTPNRAAAPRRLIPPTSTASITRSRKSCEYGFGIPAGLRPANRLNQNLPDSGIP